MASLNQRLLIIFILIIAFAGRIAVSAIASQKSSQVIVKENMGKSEKPDSGENDEQMEEKMKLEDLIVHGLTNIDFMSIASTKTKLFAGDYQLLNCTLQTLEYPPK
jgi:cell division protein YceG involved in septum cleavage